MDKNREKTLYDRFRKFKVYLKPNKIFETKTELLKKLEDESGLSSYLITSILPVLCYG
jgi:hypothetical protein